MSTIAFGVDLGGSASKIGVVDGSGAVLAERRVATPSDPGEAVSGIASALRDLSEETGRALERVGVGSPGPLILPEGRIERAPNLGWRDLPLRAMIAEAIGVDVAIDNDASAAALGEAWIGAGSGARVLLVVTLGTGVGGGVVAGGRALRGAGGRGVEIGHLVVEPDGEACECGNRGCVETRFSGRVLGASARERWGPDATPARWFEVAARGDATAVAVVERAVEALALGVAHAIVLFGPDRVVFAGGLTGSWPAFGPRLVAGASDGAGFSAGGVSFVLSQLGDRAGMIGAARMAMSAAEDAS